MRDSEFAPYSEAGPSYERVVAAKLSDTQKRALSQLRREGFIESYNGISRATIFALERAGLAKVERSTNVKETRRGGYLKSREYLTWTAYPIG